MDDSTKTTIKNCLKEFDAAIKNGDARAAKDAYIELGKILGVDVDAVPFVQRKALGLTYVGAMFEVDPVQKRTATRAALTLARTAMAQARYPRSSIAEIDGIISHFAKVLDNVDRSEVQLMSAILNATERALQYLTPLIFTDGLGYIDVDRSFSSRAAPEPEHENPVGG